MMTVGKKFGLVILVILLATSTSTQRTLSIQPVALKPQDQFKFIINNYSSNVLINDSVLGIDLLDLDISSGDELQVEIFEIRDQELNTSAFLGLLPTREIIITENKIGEGSFVKSSLLDYWQILWIYHFLQITSHEFITDYGLPWELFEGLSDVPQGVRVEELPYFATSNQSLYEELDADTNSFFNDLSINFREPKIGGANDSDFTYLSNLNLNQKTYFSSFTLEYTLDYFDHHPRTGELGLGFYDAFFNFEVEIDFARSLVQRMQYLTVQEMAFNSATVDVEFRRNSSLTFELTEIVTPSASTTTSSSTSTDSATSSESSQITSDPPSSESETGPGPIEVGSPFYEVIAIFVISVLSMTKLASKRKFGG